MTIEFDSNAYRATAKIVGLLFLAGMVVGITGSILTQSVLGVPNPLATVSSNSMKVSLGAVLWLMASAGDVAHGILMFPVLKRYSERMAIGYLGFRIADGVFIGVHVLFVLLQIPLGDEYLKASPQDGFILQALSVVLTRANLYAYHFGMIALGVAGMVLCQGFYGARLLPRFVAAWGLVGYATILGGSVLEVLGFDLRLMHTIPGGLWELFIAVWLIAKGFKSRTKTPLFS